MDKKVYAERLSELVLNKGVALEKGDYLNIVVSPDAYFYGRVMAEYAYRMGAKYVNIIIGSIDNDAIGRFSKTSMRNTYFLNNEKQNKETAHPNMLLIEKYVTI